MNKTAKEIKELAISEGVEEWFFDEITDNGIAEYTVDQLITLWNETQQGGKQNERNIH